ncbi:hypothetical protein KSD_36220 [Ktedonobacter sp. SOSP1-85]|uniref:hypothetical protein n=1 Tax=Ktedonobacter sp. SOSP1-85 TaxID=2778367 RepID=UPI0019169F57|nr:hypothetical protein [Ktedonobacter sp. SOSP1-85]GHO75851.1 hypothetical protein KSD_36220 [Ktedonobacter sp. SOSP1-85]
MKDNRLRLSYLWLIALTLCLLCAACGTPSSTGTTPPDTSAVTPTPQSTVATATPQPTVATGALYNDYAFVKNHQIWLSLHGGTPKQATKFDQIQDPPGNSFYNNFLWFDHDMFLVFTLKVLNSGIGGAGCSMGISYSRGSQLFILNTATLQITSPTLPGQQTTTKSGIPYAGPWNALVKADDTHLMGAASLTNDTAFAADIYTYDFTTSSFALTISASSIPNLNFRTTREPMLVRNGLLYYQTFVNGQYAIYSHSLTNPGAAATKIADEGNETYCPMGQLPAGYGYFETPGWDISPDGTQLIEQSIVDANANSPKTSIIQRVNLANSTATTISQDLPANALIMDTRIQWAPDGQHCSLFMMQRSVQPAGDASVNKALYTVDGLNQKQPYTLATPNNSGNLIYWQDGTHFLVYDGANINQYQVGVATGQSLLNLPYISGLSFGMA